MTLNNFRQNYHKMITDKVIMIPDVDSILKRSEKRSCLFQKIVLVSCVFIFVLVNVNNHSIDYGYHEFFSDHQNSGIYGGTENKVLGLNDDQLYYASVNYIDSKYQMTSIKKINIKNGISQTILEIEADNVMMIEDFLIYKDNTQKISIFNTIDNTMTYIKYDHEIIDYKIIKGKLLVACRDDHSLIYIYNDLNKPPMQYQLDIMIENIIDNDNTKLIYEVNGELGIYDLIDNRYRSLSLMIESLLQGAIDKSVIYNDRLLFTLDNLDGKLYSYDLKNDDLRLVTDIFNNKLITSLDVYDNELYVTVFNGNSLIYRINNTGQINHLKTIDSDRIWSIVFDNENYLLVLDNGYYLGRFNTLSQRRFLP